MTNPMSNYQNFQCTQKGAFLVKAICIFAFLPCLFALLPFCCFALLAAILRMLVLQKGKKAKRHTILLGKKAQNGIFVLGMQFCQGAHCPNLSQHFSPQRELFRLFRMYKDRNKHLSSTLLHVPPI